MPSWSSDGRWIYFTSNRSGRLQIWKMPAEAGEAIQLTVHGGFEPVESLDGKWICFAEDRGSSYIWRLPVAGGTESPLIDFHQKNYTRMWNGTQRHILRGDRGSSSIGYKVLQLFNGRGQDCR